jgi:hypothetical protein
MRRAFTIGAPSIFVNRNGLSRYPEFRDQGVGGSNPLSPTISFQAKAQKSEHLVSRQGFSFLHTGAYIQRLTNVTPEVPPCCWQKGVGFTQKGLHSCRKLVFKCNFPRRNCLIPGVAAGICVGKNQRGTRYLQRIQCGCQTRRVVPRARAPAYHARVPEFESPRPGPRKEEESLVA